MAIAMKGVVGVVILSSATIVAGQAPQSPAVQRIDLAERLGTPADQPVRVNGTDVDPNGPSIFTALPEQLGLKLESTKAPVDVLVIDHLEQPSPD